MAYHNYEKRFEIKPGRFVYIQRKDAAVRGRAAIARIKKRYKPHRIFFHFKRKGGHVAALRLHQHSSFFSRFDITNFFGQVTRTKVHRVLRQIGFTASQAFNIAVDGVVVEGGRKIVPYGFCQSPLLSTVVLEHSHLGGKLIELSRAGLLVSVYMDDILISGEDRDALLKASDAIVDAAGLAGFPLSKEKLAIGTTEVDSFNCHLAAPVVTILPDRMKKFLNDYETTNDNGRVAIEKYIDAISPKELVRFRGLIP